MTHQPSRPIFGRSAPPVGVPELALPLHDSPAGDARASVRRLRDALAARSPHSHSLAEGALRAHPADPDLLLLAALTALACESRERALALLKRYGKRYQTGRPVTLLTALGLAQQKHFARAFAMLKEERLDTLRNALPWFVG